MMWPQSQNQSWYGYWIICADTSQNVAQQAFLHATQENMLYFFCFKVEESKWNKLCTITMENYQAKSFCNISDMCCYFRCVFNIYIFLMYTCIACVCVHLSSAYLSVIHLSIIHLIKCCLENFSVQKDWLAKPCLLFHGCSVRWWFLSVNEASKI